MPGPGRAGRLYPLQPHSVLGDATGHNFDPKTTGEGKYDLNNQTVLHHRHHSEVLLHYMLHAVIIDVCSNFVPLKI